MRVVLFLVALANVALTAPSDGSPILLARAAAPTVVITNGTVIGSSDGQIDTFKGIPYAQPPTSTLRLKKPLPVNKTFGVLQATAAPKNCLQISTKPDESQLDNDTIDKFNKTPFASIVNNTSEDCLNLNVQRPAGTVANAGLPVIVWIYGGAFESGSTTIYDATNFITRSVNLKTPVVYVAMNYRVNSYGFLGGSELQAEGNTNLGLRDQRLALQWVQENIAAFGGDPTKVTIWGQSAGSLSVLLHTVINYGDNSYRGGQLFRGAIMDSGAILPAQQINSAKAQGVFNRLVSRSPCATNTTKLSCLRSLTTDQFQAAVVQEGGIFNYKSLNLSFLPRPDPKDSFYAASAETLLQQGNFTKVPVLAGSQNDEGTVFSLIQSNITNSSLLTDYLASWFPASSRQQVVNLVNSYPDDPSAGSPFGSGQANNIYPEYKRLAAILGDFAFILSRRYYLSLISSSVNAWSYLSTYFNSVPVLGTFHGTDVPTVFFKFPNYPDGLAQQTYYISFINYLNPNTLRGAFIEWPQYTTPGNSLLNFRAAYNNVSVDDFRPNQYSAYVTGLPNLHI